MFFHFQISPTSNYNKTEYKKGMVFRMNRLNKIIVLACIAGLAGASRAEDPPADGAYGPTTPIDSPNSQGGTDYGAPTPTAPAFPEDTTGPSNTGSESYGTSDDQTSSAPRKNKKKKSKKKAKKHKKKHGKKGKKGKKRKSRRY